MTKTNPEFFNRQVKTEIAKKNTQELIFMQQPEEEVWLGIHQCLVDVPGITIVLLTAHCKQDKNVKLRV